MPMLADDETGMCQWIVARDRLVAAVLFPLAVETRAERAANHCGWHW